MRDTRRQPTQLKILRGNPGKRPLPPEIRPPVPKHMPDPPEFLTSLAKEEWWKIGDELHRLGVLTVVDLKPLAAYCQAFGHWHDAETALSKMAERDPQTNAIIIKGSHGPQLNPLLKAAATAARDMVKYAAEFGLTPVARARLAAAAADDTYEHKFTGLLAS